MSTRSTCDGRATHVFVFVDICAGVAPIVIARPRAFLAGQAVVLMLAPVVIGGAALLLLGTE